MERRVSLRKQSPFLMDFENYTIGSLVPSRGNYDYDHKEYQKVRAKLQWRVEQLGWSHEKFESVENAIQRWQGYERRSNEKLKTDRYGKKYSWIAYYEMSGLLRDKGVLDDEYDWWRATTENIDPSFSSEPVSRKLIEENFLGNNKISTQDWIKDGDIPNIEPYLKVSKIEDQEGPWVVLDGYVSQENKDLARETFFFIRSFLVPNQEKEKILDFLNKQDLGGRWLPEKLEFHNTFFCEVPWSTAFPDNNTCDLSFVIGEKQVTVQRPKVEIITNDEGIKFIRHDEMEEYQETQNEYETFQAIMPVCDLKQDVTDGEVGSISTLTKKLVLDMELIGQPQSFDLHTKCGEKASCLVSDKQEAYKNNHSIFYLKEDLLIKFMEENELSLIWAIWGERNYSFSWPHRPDDSLPEPRYAVFSSVKAYQFEE